VLASDSPPSCKTRALGRERRSLTCDTALAVIVVRERKRVALRRLRGDCRLFPGRERWGNGLIRPVGAANLAPSVDNPFRPQREAVPGLCPAGLHRRLIVNAQGLRILLGRDTRASLTGAEVSATMPGSMMIAVLEQVSRKRTPLSFLRRRRAMTIDLRGWHPHAARRRDRRFR